MNLGKIIRAVVIATLIATAIVVGILQLESAYIVNVATTLAMWIALSVSWMLLSGMTGYVSLGHVVFFGLGSYITVLTVADAPLWAVLLLSGLSAVALALVVGLPCFRVRGPYFVILTFGLAEFVKFVVIDIEARASKFGRMVLGGPDNDDILWIMAGLALAAFLLAFVVARSRLGAGLRGIREDETAAATIGVPVVRLKLIVFALSAFIPGIVGGVTVFRTGYFEPTQAFNPSVSLNMITMAVIGGTDDAFGPLIGASLLVLLSELLWATQPELYMVLLGLLLVVFVIWMPDGVEGRLRLYASRRLKRV
jgi:branched-chain amino acid transport system permease protein